MGLQRRHQCCSVYVFMTLYFGGGCQEQLKLRGEKVPNEQACVSWKSTHNPHIDRATQRKQRLKIGAQGLNTGITPTEWGLHCGGRAKKIEHFCRVQLQLCLCRNCVEDCLNTMLSIKQSEFRISVEQKSSSTAYILLNVFRRRNDLVFVVCLVFMLCTFNLCLCFEASQSFVFSSFQYKQVNEYRAQGAQWRKIQK